MPEIRPFQRNDRDALLSLVNRHIAAVLPGVAVPASALLHQLERDYTEPIVDPWVVERSTIVGYERDRLVAAAYVKRFGTDPRVSESFHDVGEVTWFVFWRGQEEAARGVLGAAIAQLRSWDVHAWYADGSLPAPGVYGPPEAWPHVTGLYREAGFEQVGHVEVQFVVSLDEVPEPGRAPIEELTVRRVMGDWGTVFEAVLEGEVVGTCEIEDDYTKGGVIAGLQGWGDLQDVTVREDLRRRGIGSWLFRTAAAWMRLGGTRRFLAYAVETPAGDSPDPRLAPFDVAASFYTRQGFVPLNRIPRAWRRDPSPP